MKHSPERAALRAALGDAGRSVGELLARLQLVLDAAAEAGHASDALERGPGYLHDVGRVSGWLHVMFAETHEEDGD